MITEAGAPPSIFLHVCDVYDRMMQQATHQKIDQDQSGHVYSGHMTKLIMGPPLNLPIPYYTQIRRALIGMGCAVQLKRGGGSSPSRWLLCEKPTYELFQKYDNAAAETATKAKSKTALNEQMIRDLGSRLDALEEAFGDLVAALGDNDNGEG